MAQAVIPSEARDLTQQEGSLGLRPRGDKSALLEVKGLRTEFRSGGSSFAAVDGISFSLAPGETLGIVGESGCGKSVTSLSIMRLVPNPPGRITAGEIVLEGRISSTCRRATCAPCAATTSP